MNHKNVSLLPLGEGARRGESMAFTSHWLVPWSNARCASAGWNNEGRAKANKENHRWQSSAVKRFALAVLLLALLPSLAQASRRNTHHFPATHSPHTRLHIQSSTDLAIFTPVIEDYQARHPSVEIIYEETISQHIDPDTETPPDLIISTSMDLQTRLVNAGHALTWHSAHTDALPAWAHWRRQLFATGYEPIVIVYNRQLMPSEHVPRTRQHLLERLRAPGLPLNGKIGTYDAEHSGVGYLLATQDSETGSIARALFDALGDNHVHLATHAHDLLDRLTRGEITLAYNIPGSYARARIAEGAPLAMVLPEDGTFALLRTALIPRHAKHANEAGQFLDDLLSPHGQTILAHATHLTPLAAAPTGPAGQSLRPIVLGPGLLVYLDTLKRQQFLEAWRSRVRAGAD